MQITCQRVRPVAVESVFGTSVRRNGSGWGSNLTVLLDWMWKIRSS